jgi:UDP-glucose 4-epimerase
VYVEDVARANVLAMASDATDDVFNVGSGDEVTVRDLVHQIIALAGMQVEPEYRTDERALMVRRVGSSEKAARRLGFATTVPLRQGLARVLDAAGLTPATGAQRKGDKVG